MIDQRDDDGALDALRRSDSDASRREAERARDGAPPLGRGMTAADSRGAPLSADTGEPGDGALGDADRDMG